MVTKTDRITGSDGKLYDLTYDLVPAEFTQAVVTPATFKPESWKFVDMKPVAVVVPPPPPPPPPPNPTGPGLITEFSGAGDKSFKIDGVSATAHNAGEPYNLQSPDTRSLRFELHHLDNWISAPGGFNDAQHNNGAERNEIQLGGNFGPGATAILAYDLEIAPGPVNTAQWLLLSQIHQTPQEGPPPFAIELVGERMRVQLRRTGGTIPTWTDAAPIVRGKVYKMRYQVKFDATNGIANVWRDGVQIMKYAGPLGYTSQAYYWKLGVYREASLETTVATFRNIARA